MNITGKINLRQLKSAVRMMNGANGEIECLVIPIEANKLFKGEKGLYIDLIAFEIKDKPEGRKDTHLIKQSLPKDELEKMTETDRNAMPILGSLTVWKQWEAEPQNVVISETPSTSGVADDLPF